MSEKRSFPLIDDFKVFLTVIKKNSFSNAAKELGQSNAYITKRINILEETLHTKLFYRNTRHIQLTTAGEFVRQQALEIIDKTENLLTNISEDKKAMFGHLRKFVVLSDLVEPIYQNLFRFLPKTTRI